MKPEVKKIRVQAGKIKGMSIECPPGEIRPMMSKVKEALFNIIGNCEEMEMLDLYSGSASISIEAFSHGAKSADIVEADYGKKEILFKNIKKAGFENAKIYISDAIAFCQRAKKQYDFIMCDPPFKMENKEKILEVISESNLLKDDGFAVIHLPKKEHLPEIVGDLEQYDNRKYGLNVIAFYSKKEKTTP